MWTSDANVIAVQTETVSAIVPDDGLITIQQVMAITQLSENTIYRDIDKGSFPAPIKVSGSNRWLRLELVDYLMQRVIERNQRYEARAAQAARSMQKKNAASL